MGSRRLPGKTLMPLHGEPLIARVLERLRLIGPSIRIAVLTTDTPSDDPLADWCRSRSVECFRGSEENVLDRYHQAAKAYQADHIVRATADNPFVEPYFAAGLLETHLSSRADYSSNKSEVGSFLPDGLGVEIFTFECLARSARESTKPNHFEHVNEYVLENPERFKIVADKCEAAGRDLSGLRLTVDTREDFAKAERIFGTGAYHPRMRLPELVRLAG
jgi:spore coat polysaccharide biosynthesis protein SpsF